MDAVDRYLGKTQKKKAGSATSKPDAVDRFLAKSQEELVGSAGSRMDAVDRFLSKQREAPLEKQDAVDRYLSSRGGVPPEEETFEEAPREEDEGHFLKHPLKAWKGATTEAWKELPTWKEILEPFAKPQKSLLSPAAKTPAAAFKTAIKTTGWTFGLVEPYFRLASNMLRAFGISDLQARAPEFYKEAVEAGAITPTTEMFKNILVVAGEDRPTTGSSLGDVMTDILGYGAPIPLVTPVKVALKAGKAVKAAPEALRAAKAAYKAGTPLEKAFPAIPGVARAEEAGSKLERLGIESFRELTSRAAAGRAGAKMPVKPAKPAAPRPWTEQPTGNIVIRPFKEPEPPNYASFAEAWAGASKTPGEERPLKQIASLADSLGSPVEVDPIRLNNMTRLEAARARLRELQALEGFVSAGELHAGLPRLPNIETLKAMGVVIKEETAATLKGLQAFHQTIVEGIESGEALKITNRATGVSHTIRGFPENMPSILKFLQTWHKGEPYTEWYQRAANEVERILGNRDESYKLLDFLAATSIHNETLGNLTSAFKAFARWRSGVPLEGGIDIPGVASAGFMDPHLNGLKAALSGLELPGPKVNPFAKALHGDPNAIVLDEWMMRAFGFSNAAPSPGQRAAIEEYIRRLSDLTRNTPREVQARIWGAVRDGWENGRWLNGKLHQRAVKGSSEADWGKMLEGKWEYQISMELAHPDAAPASKIWPSLYDDRIPFDQRMDITRRGAGAIFEDIMSEYKPSGATPEAIRRSAWVLENTYGPGGYLDYPPAPSMQLRVLASPEAIEEIIGKLAYRLEQESVVAHRINAAPGALPNAIRIIQEPAGGGLATEKGLGRFWAELSSRVPEFTGYAPAKTVDSAGRHIGIDIINFSDVSWTEQDFIKFQKAINDAAEAAKTGHLNVGSFVAERKSTFNDWSKNPDGKGHLAWADKRQDASAIHRRLVDHHRRFDGEAEDRAWRTSGPEARKVYDEFRATHPRPDSPEGQTLSKARQSILNRLIGNEEGFVSIGGRKAKPKQLLDDEMVSAFAEMAKVYASKGADVARQVVKEARNLTVRLGTEDLGRILKQAGLSDYDPVVASLQVGARSAGDTATELANTFEKTNETYRVAREQATSGQISEAGTITKDVREMFREAGQPARELTREFKFSEADIQRSTQEMVNTVKQFNRLELEFSASADPLAANVLKIARRNMEQAMKQWQSYRSAAGRAVQIFDHPVPDEIIHSIREAGYQLKAMPEIRQKLPITYNIMRSLRHPVKNIAKASPQERTRLFRDFIDQFRLNLFSVTSWSLDFIGNLSSTVGEVGAAVGHDFAYFAKTKTFDVPQIQGLLRALRYRAEHAFQPMSPDMEAAFGKTIGGEIIAGSAKKGHWGTFTKREGVLSTIVDYQGLPLYAKGAMDTFFKRLVGTSYLYRDAIKAADAAKLSGADRAAFIDKFLTNPPEFSAVNAITHGNAAGFNRPLSGWEEAVGRSTTARMIVSAFMRWPFQFTRWASDMLALNPAMLTKIVKGEVAAEEVGAYLGRAATGWGGLALINGLYDRIDFRTMEYIHPDGSRTRLSNRDPINTGLFFLAVLQENPGDAWRSLQFASIPGAPFIGGQGISAGGLLSGIIAQAQQIAKYPDSPRRWYYMKEEMTDLVNRAIPGQALLSALKSVFDPITREGLGANLPGVSLLKPPAISSTTGEPLKLRQKMPVTGIEMPAIGGTPIPGMQRILDPVAKLLLRFGFTQSHPIRTSVAGYPAAEIPEGLRREWEQEFGKRRFEKLLPLALNMSDTIAGWQGLSPEDLRRKEEKMRKRISELDSRAARQATTVVNLRYASPKKVPRRATEKEMARPRIYREGGL